MTCLPCKKRDEPPEKKEICGFRVWYYIDGKIRQFKGSTFEIWKGLPADGFQLANLYENWCVTEGVRYQRALSGHKRYFCAPDPNGLIFGRESVDSEKIIKRRYPGASVKRGREAPLPIWEKINKQADAATDF